MKIKKITAFVVACVALMFGVWACSEYKGREALKPSLMNQSDLPVAYTLPINSTTEFHAVVAAGNTVLSLLSQSDIQMISDSTEYTLDGEARSLLFAPVLDKLTNAQMVEYFALFGYYSVSEENIQSVRVGQATSIDFISVDLRPDRTYPFFVCKPQPGSPSGHACRIVSLFTCTPMYCEKP